MADIILIKTRKPL